MHDRMTVILHFPSQHAPMALQHTHNNCALAINMSLSVVHTTIILCPTTNNTEVQNPPRKMQVACNYCMIAIEMCWHFCTQHEALPMRLHYTLKRYPLHVCTLFTVCVQSGATEGMLKMSPFRIRFLSHIRATLFCLCLLFDHTLLQVSDMDLRIGQCNNHREKGSLLSHFVDT